jgi:hypothetical protein
MQVTANASVTLRDLTSSNCDTSTETTAAAGNVDSGSTLHVSGSTFSSYSGFHGGAISNDGRLTISNSTFSGNTAFAAGAIHSGTFDIEGPVAIASNGTMTLINIILAGNTASMGGVCDGSTPINGGGNLEDDGGHTQTIALGSGSGAIGAASAHCPATDQRGAARPTPCDSGAPQSGASPGR